MPVSPSRLGRIYCHYLRGPAHPCKLRILRILETFMFPKQGLPFEVDGGIRLHIHPGIATEYNLLKGGTYQKTLNTFTEQNIGAGETVLIAGVSFGQQVILASRAVGPDGHVVAVDPAPHALLRAQCNLTLNNWTRNVQLVSAALGAESCIAPIKANPPEEVQHASLVKPTGSVPFYVLIENVAQILERLSHEQLDTLLLDVIGYEIPVLKGIRPPYLPKLMTVAIHPYALEATGATLSGHIEVLEQMGYSCWTLEGAPAESAQGLRGCQLVAVKNGSAKLKWLIHDSRITPGQWDC
jgi:FkbM family methyltransferase